MKVLFIYAHPDDETFATGGTIAKLVRDGHTINVITATTGQAGQTGEYGKINPDELAEIRIKEQDEAARILGIEETHYLDFYDGQLINESVNELARLLVPLIEERQPDIVITFEKNGASNHPDHKQMSLAATQAFKEYMKYVKKHVRLYYLAVPKSYLEAYEKSGLTMKAFGTARGTPDEDITTIVDISDVFEIKDKAARAHKSQAEDWERSVKRREVVDAKKEYFELIAESDLI